MRAAAAKKIHSLLKKFDGQDDIYINCVIENIRGFSASTRYTQRQTFLLMCQNLMRNKKLFLEEFAETFLTLAQDSVSNVRITAGLVLLKNIKKTSFLCNS